MKKLLLILCTLAIFLISYAQNCTEYFPNKEGSVLKYQLYDKKNNPSETNTVTLRTIRDEGTSRFFNVSSKLTDGKENKEVEYTMECNADGFFIDMERFVTDEMTAPLENFELDVISDELEYPNSLSTGMSLKDGKILLKVKNNDMPIDFSTTITIKDRKVVAEEKITTESGTYDCYKITYTTEVSNIMKMEMQCVEWISKGVGVVKTETYRKGKLISSMKLVSVEF